MRNMEQSSGASAFIFPRRGVWEFGFLIFLILSVALIASACNEHPRDNSDHPRSAVNGTLWIRNQGTGSWTEEERWIASVSLTLGRIEGEGADLFGRVWGLAVDSVGNLFVLDALAQEIRVFDRDGLHLRTFGGRGEGPGEFGYADGLRMDSEGTLWVFDPRRACLTSFRPDGTYLGSVHRPIRGSVVPWPAEFLPDGSVVDWFFSLPERNRSLPGASGSLDLYEPIRLYPGEERVDTFPGIEVRYPTVGETRIPMAGRFAFVQSSAGPSFWSSHISEYKLVKRSLSGDTLLIVSLEGVRPSSITPTEADSLNRALNELARLRPPGAPKPPSRRDLPRHRPVVDRLLLDDEGHLLVFPRLEGFSPGAVMDVFIEDTGEYLGRVDLPVPLAGREFPALALNRQLCFVVRGEFDVQRVVRLELQ